MVGLVYGRTKTTTRSIEGMAWEIAMVWGLERDFCREKRPPKKKIVRRLRTTCRFITLIFDPEKGSLRLR